MSEAVIVDCVRTGLAKSFRGSFNQTRPDDMVGHCIRSLMDRNPKTDAAILDDCVVGCGLPEGPQGMNVGRVVTVVAGLPITVSGMTLNRYCSSGLQAIAVATAAINTGNADAMLAGGVESITMLQNNLNMNNLANPLVMERKPGIYMPMGQTAEIVAKRYKVSRQLQDEYALSSQLRTAKAQEDGLFADEIVPMTVTWKKKDKATGESADVEVVVDRDECNRPNTTLEGLQSLRPAFSGDGSVTAGNSSQFSDGAAMALIVEKSRAEALGLRTMGALRNFVVAGVEPDEMGIGPVKAVPKLLKKAGMKLDDIDLIELNEAFAVQVVYCRDQLGFDPEKLNVNGGSISIGHPYGATGARQVGHILRELKRRGKRFGIVTMCVGGGMGAAGLIEAF